MLTCFHNSIEHHSLIKYRSETHISSISHLFFKGVIDVAHIQDYSPRVDLFSLIVLSIYNMELINSQYSTYFANVAHI